MKLRSFITLVLIIGVAVLAKADKLDGLRTSKKIISMDAPQAPYFAIQIIALKQAPQMPEFFHNVEMAREYRCNDGYLRFCVGDFNSYDEAKAAVASVKADGYDQAFVVDTRSYQLNDSEYNNGSSSDKKIDPNKTYTIQLSAFRFPVYLSHFKDLDNVMEFYMKDKIFRYTIGQFKGSVAADELAKIKAHGYKDAHLVELDKYLPFKIE